MVPTLRTYLLPAPKCIPSTLSRLGKVVGPARSSNTTRFGGASLVMIPIYDSELAALTHGIAADLEAKLAKEDTELTLMSQDFNQCYEDFLDSRLSIKIYSSSTIIAEMHADLIVKSRARMAKMEKGFESRRADIRECRRRWAERVAMVEKAKRYVERKKTEREIWEY